MAEKQTKTPVIVNRKARHDYLVLETMEAGIVLHGPEVKSLREGNGSLAEAFGRVDKGEVFLYNMYIGPYKHSPDFQQEVDARRPRKLLLHRREIQKILQATNQKGLTLVPLKLWFTRGWAKLEIGLAKGKQKQDRRETIKRREIDREIRRYRKK